LVEEAWSNTYFWDGGYDTFFRLCYRGGYVSYYVDLRMDSLLDEYSPRRQKPAAGFPVASFHRVRHGYDPGDVDALIDWLRALPDTAEGRRDACELAGAACFHLARRDGYDPGEVDGYLDAVVKSWCREDGPGPA
jgi:DivIVA domain-containing protein